MSKVICIDELDKMSGQFQNQLLSFLDSGHIKVDHQRKSYDDDFKIRVSRSLPHVTKLTGYRNLCRHVLGVYTMNFPIVTPQYADEFVKRSNEISENMVNAIRINSQLTVIAINVSLVGT